MSGGEFMRRVLIVFLVLFNLIIANEKKYYHFEGKLQDKNKVIMDLNIYDTNSVTAFVKIGSVVEEYTGKLDKGILDFKSNGKQFKGKIEDGIFLGKFIRGQSTQKISFEEKVDETIFEYSEISNLNLLPYYKEEAFEVKEEDYAYTEEYVNSSAIIYNNKKFLQVEEFFYEYTGGAHGIYGYSHKIYDKETGNDITKEFFQENLDDKLQKEIHNFLLKKAKIQGLGIFDDAIFYLGDFYMTDTGFYFVYNVYDIGSYAAGVQKVYVPFKEFPKKFLKKNEITKRIIEF